MAERGGRGFAGERTPCFLPSPRVLNLTNMVFSQPRPAGGTLQDTHLIRERQEVFIKQNCGAGYREILRSSKNEDRVHLVRASW